MTSPTPPAPAAFGAFPSLPSSSFVQQFLMSMVLQPPYRPPKIAQPRDLRMQAARVIAVTAKHWDC